MKAARIWLAFHPKLDSSSTHSSNFVPVHIHTDNDFDTSVYVQLVLAVSKLPNFDYDDKRASQLGDMDFEPQDCVTSEEWHRAGLPVPTPREVESIGALELARFLRDKREVS